MSPEPGADLAAVLEQAALATRHAAFEYTDPLPGNNTGRPRR